MALSINFGTNSYSDLVYDTSNTVTYYAYNNLFDGDSIRRDPDLLYSLDYKSVIFEESFLREFEDNINWYMVSDKQMLDNNFIRECVKIYKVGDNFWNWVSNHAQLTEKLVEEFADKLNWRYLLEHNIFDVAFLEKHIDKLHWASVSTYQQLTHDFIRKYRHFLKWDWLIKNTRIDWTEDFLLEMKKYIKKWDEIGMYIDLDEKFMKKYGISINLTNFWAGKRGWQFTDTVSYSENVTTIK